MGWHIAGPLFIMTAEALYKKQGIVLGSSYQVPYIFPRFFNTILFGYTPWNILSILSDCCRF